MNATFQTVRIGIFFVLGVALIYAVFSVMGSSGFRRAEGYALEATFDNLRTLTSGADVRVAGVRIGEISQIRLVNGRGQVTLRIDAQHQLPEDSIARIMMSSLLGQNYLAIEFGRSGTMLGEGAVISTEESADFNQILAEVQTLGQRLNEIAENFAGFGADSGMGDLFANLNALVTENRERFDNTMINIETLTTKLNSREGTIGKLINDDSLYGELMQLVDRLNQSADDMGTAFGGVRDLVAQVAAGEGTLGRLIVDDGIITQVEATIANLREFSDALNSGSGTLGKLVTDDALYSELRQLLSKANQALDNLGDAGPISAAGAISGALF